MSYYEAHKLSSRISYHKTLGKLISMENIINTLVKAGQSRIADINIALDDENTGLAVKILKEIGVAEKPVVHYNINAEKAGAERLKDFSLS